jgi:hypothetical protein
MTEIRTVLLILLPTTIILFIVKKFIINFLKQIKELNEIANHGKTIDGIIVDYRADKDPSGVESYLTKVHYIINEEEFEILNQYPVKEKPVFGTKVTIYYNSKNPEKAVLDIDQALKKNFIGLIFLIIMIGLIIFFSIKSLL